MGNGTRLNIKWYLYQPVNSEY